MTDEYTLTARYVFPVAAERSKRGTFAQRDGLIAHEPPLERGTVTVRNGRIAAVLPHGERTPDRDLGDAAIVPGFVNAHTHLDLTGAKGRTPPTPDFVGWLRQVIAFRKERTPGQVADDVRAGIAECLQSGTTLVGDIAVAGGTWDLLAESPLRAVVFDELIGLSEQRWRDVWYDPARIERSQRRTDRLRAGVSPHAPYSASRDLIHEAAVSQLPFSMHLAESAAEVQFLDDYSGPFVDFLRGLNVAWHPHDLIDSFREVLLATYYNSRPLYAHCNFLDILDFDLDLWPHSSVAYCPRTHAAFGHPTHPFRRLLANGVRVALGTDSLASNPDLSVLAEARFIRERYPEFDGATLLHMATLAGAEALGWADECGTLEPGKSADFAVVELPPHDARDPHDLLFTSDRPVRATVFRGELVAGNW